MDKKEFLDFTGTKEYSPADLLLFESAINLVEQELADKKRLSGGSFVEHNLRVGLILAENGFSPEIVLGGLLHGLISDAQKKRIKASFGSEVLSLVEEVEEIEQFKHKNPQLEAEALRKIMMITLKDIRVMIVKLANKLDNLRTLGALPEKEQQRIAQEVLEVYAPLAYRLGLDKIKVQLENVAFKVLNPKAYHGIETFLNESSEEREKDVVKAIDWINRIAGDKVKILSIKGRPKHIYSIYKKNIERKVPLQELYDLLGVRILVPEIKDCYSLLGILHEKLESCPDRLKDYIANPKPNFYRSIHTALKLPNGKIVEVQIRTPEMDEFAEGGIAAHWRYKKLNSEDSFEKKMSWLKGLLELQKSAGNKEFLEAVKVDVFGDSIYCYTPKGDVRELPKSSTVLDFAFFVHEEIGGHAVGGKINGKFVPLRTELASGEVVEIITNKKQHPSRSWLKVARSARARQKIRKYLQQSEKLPALRCKVVRPESQEEESALVEAEDCPTAICTLAKCCAPLPEDNIVGITTKRRVISVHREDCKQALKEEKRWLSVQWKESFSQKIRFLVEAEERSGLLADLLHTIALAGFEVKEAKAKLMGRGGMQCSFVVIPRDLEHLRELVRKARKVKGIKKIYFE